MSRARAGKAPRTRPAPGAPADASLPPPRPSRLGLAIVAALGATLLLAPPDSNAWWGLNGFRSVPAGVRAALLAVAAGSALLARPGPRGRAAGWILAALAAWAIAFPLRERIHFLGDTQLRSDDLGYAAIGRASWKFGDLSGALHASPLDVVVNMYLPLGLTRLGWSTATAVSLGCFAQALAYLAGIRRLAARLELPPAAGIAMTAALALSGLLETYAGYLDSSGLILAAAAWWWSELLAPLDRNRRAARVAVAAAVLCLSHRMGAVMLLPQLARALGAPIEGDRPGPRRWLLGLTVAVGIAIGALMAGGQRGGQLASDLGDLMLSARTHGLKLASPSDLANTLLLVCPLFFLAPALAGRGAVRDALRRAATWLPLLAAVPMLLLLAWLFPLGLSGLGAHRDWDVNMLLGLALTLAGGSLLARMPRPRLLPSLAACLPVLALGSGAWLAVNADEAASLRRVEALATAPGHLEGAQLGHLYRARGNWHVSRSRWTVAGESFDRSYELNPNPRIAILAARSWVMARDPAAARRSLDRVRAAGPLPPAYARLASQFDSLIVRLERVQSQRPMGRGSAPR